jgi:glycosyltransferase involved in cell wall biosynthesis
VRGIDVTPDDEIILAEPEDFPEAIITLSEDPDLRHAIGEAGRRLAAEKYTWESSSQKVRSLICETLEV